VTPVASTVDRVEQRLAFVNQAEKTALLIQLLRSEPVELALAFSRTKHGADMIVRHL
jgi:ATP-dependent RNA helicase RhlE